MIETTVLEEKINALLVEADPSDARMIATLLIEYEKGSSIQLDRVEGFAKGLDRLELGGVDVVLLDLDLPGSQGEDTFAAMRACCPEVPVVVLTGDNDESTGLSFVRRGAQDYLVKGQFDGAALARAIRYAVERQRTEQALQHRNRQLALLNRASQHFTSTLDLDEVLGRVLDEVQRQMGVAGAFWLIDPQQDELVCRQASGPFSDTVRGWRMPADQGLVGWVVQHGKSLNVRDALRDERHFKGIDKETGMLPRSLLSVPLKSKDKTIGVLQVLDEKAGSFSEADQALLESLGAIAATAVQNAYLFDEVQRMAITDFLTGLYNRRGFFTLAEQQFKIAARNQRWLALIYLDLDEMKAINDTYGHNAGDLTLIEAAKLIRGSFRDADIKARLGGDEFVVLALDAPPLESPTLLDRLQRNLAARNREAPREDRFSISYGLAHFDPAMPCSIDELVADADAAMYAQKQRPEIRASQASHSQARDPHQPDSD